jgi:hypothetical protein
MTRVNGKAPPKPNAFGVDLVIEADDFTAAEKQEVATAASEAATQKRDEILSRRAVT